MATYAVGDLQGCLSALHRLLDVVGFDPRSDRLWLAGDLVNRGPRSLETLRFVRDLGDRAVTVLGNHDLHLLAVASGAAAPRGKDTLDEILAAPDRDELLGWLRTRPLLHRDLGFTMVHAGIAPPWTIDQAVVCAAEVSAVIGGDEARAFFDVMYGDQPDQWSEALAEPDRLRYSTNALTRMRYCTADGRLRLAEKRPPGMQPDDLLPWFAVPQRQARGESIIFGHWATLQVDQPLDPAHGVVHLDTGCVWGGRLSAMRLEDRAMFSVPCEAP